MDKASVDGRGKWERPPLTLDIIFDRSIPIPECGCWVWLGTTNQFGYGRNLRKGKHTVVHRLAYELANGPVPEGLDLDHLCRVRSCVNPAHLEPVTRLINARRGICGEVNRKRILARTHCKHGHEYTKENTYIHPTRKRRQCRECMRRWDDKSRGKQ